MNHNFCFNKTGKRGDAFWKVLTQHAAKGKSLLIGSSFLASLFMGGACVPAPQEEMEPLTGFVDPYIGTGDHGHVFLGANVPFGFVQLGPTQPCRGWDWCSGYHHSDSVLIGFSHTHLSGTGIGELGDVAFLPVKSEQQQSVRFSHEQETVEPGYYAVRLKEEGVLAELTATARTGFHRYSLTWQQDTLRLRLDLRQGIGWDAMTQSNYSLENDTLLTGCRFSTGWAKDQKLFFAARFSSPVVKAVMLSDSIALLSFVPQEGSLMVKVGLSAASCENALLNLDSENPGWNFAAVRQEADRLWNNELGKIRISTSDAVCRRIFYTSLYHTMVAPSIFCDVNGDYRGADGKVHRKADFVNYTTFSLWDTYRAAHPLATLIHPERMRDWAETLLHICDEQGKLPVWHLMGCETDCMVGNPAIPVLADMLLKGVKMDRMKALQAMMRSALLDERSMGLLKQYGYIPFDKEPTNETTAKGLEYALADGCIAQVALKLGVEKEAMQFAHRANSFTHYFDKESRFMRGLSSEGKFSEPFDPFYTAPGKGDYTEGNAWQYAWLVPHDVHGLIRLFGGEEPFVQKLDSLFIVEGDLGAEAAPDVSGLIGQYAHGNEPSHHVIYLYHYAGQPWKAAPRLREVMEKLYHDAPAGICGNEDVGQMSAWYVLSSMGLYQVEPAGGKYIIGSPLFDEASIRVADGKSFRIVTHHNSKENIYIQRASLDGEPYSKSYLLHEQIMKGGTLELQMGPEPSDWGTRPEDRP